MEEVTTAELTLKDFILKCYDLFGNRIKIKFHHTTRGDTWEITVRDDNKEVAFQIVKWIDNKLQELTLIKEVQDARKELPPKV